MAKFMAECMAKMSSEREIASEMAIPSTVNRDRGLLFKEASQRIFDSMEVTQGEYHTQPAIRLNQAHTKQLQVG